MNVNELYEEIGNYQEARSRLMNDKLMGRFVTLFLEDPSYAELVKAHEEKNVEDTFRAAHALKGVSGNLALTRIYGISSAITEIYRSRKEIPEDEAQVENLFASLKEEYARVSKTIRSFISDGGL